MSFTIPYASDRPFQRNSRISDLIMEQGRQRAEGQMRGGQILGNTLGSLGSIAAGVFQQRSDDKARAQAMAAKAAADAPRMAQEAQMRDLDIQTKKAGLDNQTREAQQAAALSDLFNDPTKPPTPTQIIGIMGPQKGLDIAKGLQALQPDSEKEIARYRNQHELFRDAISGIVSTPAPLKQSAWTMARAGLLQKGLITEDMVPADWSPEAEQTAVSFGRAPEKHQGFDLKETSKGLQVWDPNKGTLGAVVGAPKVAPQDVTDLSPAGLNMAALNYKKTGIMPALGNGDKTTRKKIIDRAASLTQEDEGKIMAGGVDIAANKAGYQADSGSLKKLQAQYDAVSAFEGTANKNASALKAMLSKMPDSGVRFLNTPLRALASQFGSTDMAAINTLRQSVQNEYSRIISNPTLSGTMSDSARKEGEALLAKDMTLGQLVSSIDALGLEAGNRRSSYGEELKTIQGRISGKKPEEDGGWQVINGIKIRVKK